MSRLAEEERLNVAVVGGESAGKSSLCGAVLAAKSPDSRDVSRLKELAVAMGRPSSWAGWVMDKRHVERYAGRTVDGNVAQLILPHRALTLLDTPGHPKYLQKAVTLLCQADVALVVIPANLTSVAQKTSALLTQKLATLFMFQKRELVIAVSQMDCCHHSQEVFCGVAAEVRKIMKRIGFSHPEGVPVVPVSMDGCGLGLATLGLKAEEKCPAPTLMDWYAGPGLLQILQDMPKPPPKDAQGPALVLFTKAYKIRGVGQVICGCVLRGTVRNGDELMLVPGCIKICVGSIHFFHSPAAQALPGMHVGFGVRSSGPLHLARLRKHGMLLAGRDRNMRVDLTFDYANKEDHDKALRQQRRMYNIHGVRGNVLWMNANRLTLSGADDHGFTMPRGSRRLIADVRIVRDKLGKQSRMLCAGSSLLLNCFLHSARVRVRRLVATLDRQFRVLEFIADPGACAAKGQILRIEFESSTRSPILVDTASAFTPLARIVLSDAEGLVAAGVVRELRPPRPLRVVTHCQGNLGHSFIDSLRDYFELSILTVKGFGAEFNSALHGAHLVVLDFRACHVGLSSSDACQLEPLERFIHGGGSLLVVTSASKGAHALLKRLGLVVQAVSSKVPARVELCTELRRQRVVTRLQDGSAPISFLQWARAQRQHYHSSCTQTQERVPTARRHAQPVAGKGQRQSQASMRKGVAPLVDAGSVSEHVTLTEQGGGHAQLNERGLRIALEFAASPHTLAVVEAVCFRWLRAADETPWRIACEHDCADDCPVSHLQWLDDAAQERLRELARRNPWKASVALYCSAVKSCAGLVDGPHGHTSYVMGTPTASFHASTDHALGSGFQRVCALGRRFGGGAVMMHLPRNSYQLSGQVLVTNVVPPMKLALNFAAEAARHCAE